MRLFLLAVFVLWIAPVKMGAAVHWQEGVHARLALGVTCWGVRFSKQYLKPYPSGRLEKHSEEHADSEALLVEGKAEKGDAADSSGLRMLMRVLKTVLIGNRARQYFRRTSHTEGLYLVFYTGTRDAAACALADAGIKTLLGILCTHMPNGRYDARAAGSEKAGIQGICIVSLRLGNLLIAALLGTMAYLVSGRRKKEERKWNIIPFRT